MATENLTAALESAGLPLKTCTKCRLALDPSSFYRNAQARDGLLSRCKACQSAMTSKWWKDNPEWSRQRSAEWRSANPEKAREVCSRSAKKAYAANPDKFKELAKAQRERDLDGARATSREYRKANPEKVKAILADYYKANADKIKARVKERAERLRVELRPANAERAMRRVARKRQATPAWADRAAILALYEEAARLSQATGTPHNVDHIVPLQSKLVCGLHVPANMRVIPRADNQSKGNYWWPDMP